MKLIHYIIIIALSLVWVAYAKAQTINPNSMLGTENYEQQMPAPDLEEQPNVDPTNPPQEWMVLSRGLSCNSIGVVRGILAMRGQTIWAAGSNLMNERDPFNAIVIVKNPVTQEHTVLLMKTQHNLACIVAYGAGIEVIDNKDQGQN